MIRMLIAVYDALKTALVLTWGMSLGSEITPKTSLKFAPAVVGASAAVAAAGSLEKGSIILSTSRCDCLQNAAYCDQPLGSKAKVPLLMIISDWDLPCQKAQLRGSVKDILSPRQSGRWIKEPCSLTPTPSELCKDDGSAGNMT